jgi:DNA-binding response OmpR family regulator
MSRPLLLLVDDAPEMGLIVRSLARRADCDLVYRTAAQGAREFLREAVPTLLLLDVRLPGESGVDLCRGLRADPERSTLPVALFTSWGFPGDVAAGIEAGADFVFAKDLVCDPPAWIARLTEILACLPSLARSYSQSAMRSVHYPLLPADWTAVLEQAFRDATLRRMGLEVNRALVGRALAHVMELPGPALDAAVGLLFDEWTLSAQHVFRASPPERVSAFIARLAELVCFAVGTAASASFREALRQGFPWLPKLADE